MRSTCTALILLAAAALPAAAAPRCPSGAFEVRGVTPRDLGPGSLGPESSPPGSYRGLARVSLDHSGRPYLNIERGALRGAGPLVSEGEEWVLRLRSGSLGAAGVLSGVTPSEASLEARYRWVEAPLSGGRRGRWEGRWRLRGPAGAWEDAGREVWSRVEAPALRIVISVDWEGRDLRAENLSAMESFRDEFPALPLTHFLNAAYYTKPGLAPADLAERLAPALRDAAAPLTSASAQGWGERPELRALTARIARTLRPRDERGLHVHAWRSLVEAAGVEFRAGPTFWGAERPLQRSGDDEGHEVELGAYSEAEVRRLVRASRLILAGQGLSPTRAFRAGGWVAPSHVLAALRAEGLRIDSSAVATCWHDELEGLALKGRIETLWAEIQPSSQPYLIQTAHGELIEMPDTGALADYVTAAEMIAEGRRGLAELERAPGEVYMHFGFHQETAARFLPRLAEALRVLRAEGGPRIAFETISASAARYRRALAGELARQERLRAGSSSVGLPLPSADE